MIKVATYKWLESLFFCFRGLAGLLDEYPAGLTQPSLHVVMFLAGKGIRWIRILQMQSVFHLFEKFMPARAKI